jgi:hypothetical protein
MGEIIFILFVAAVAFMIPILFRATLEFVQVLAGIGCLIYMVFIKVNLDLTGWFGLLFVSWVLGSLCALSLRNRESAREVKHAHEIEYHLKKEYRKEIK